MLIIIKNLLEIVNKHFQLKITMHCPFGQETVFSVELPRAPSKHDKLDNEFGLDVDNDDVGGGVVEVKIENAASPLLQLSVEQHVVTVPAEVVPVVRGAHVASEHE